jgi:hypothetical protein
MGSSIGLSKIVGAQVGVKMDTFVLKEELICAELIPFIFSLICKVRRRIRKTSPNFECVLGCVV